MKPQLPVGTSNNLGEEKPQVARRDFLKTSALGAMTAVGAATLPSVAAAENAPRRKKTFLVVEGHMDDAEIGAGGAMIQAARAGHRVVIITVAGDYTSWDPTRGREAATESKLVELARSFGFEKRLLRGKYHQTTANLELKRTLADIYVELKPDVCLISHYEDHWPDHRESGLAAKDAFLFSHGLSTHDLTPHRAKLILAYGVTPVQTYHFEPDVYYDVGDVMPEYMDLIARVEAIRTGRTVEQEIRYEVQTKSGRRKPMALSAHGFIRFAEAARWGNAAGCEFAVGFRTVFGQVRGPDLI